MAKLGLTLILFSLISFGFVLGGEYISLAGRTYYISYPQKYTWYQAYRYCAANGMYLVDIRTESENKRIVQVLAEFHNKTAITSQSYWTSGTDIGSEGQFYWMTTGYSLVYQNWNASNPDNRKRTTSEETTNCLRTITPKYYWIDEWCTVTSSFICRDTFDVPIYKTMTCSMALDSN